MSTLDLIKHHDLLVRPSLCGGWRAGKWKGVTADNMGRAYCEDGTEWEDYTLEGAVNRCVQGLETGTLNPQWVRAVEALGR